MYVVSDVGLVGTKIVGVRLGGECNANIRVDAEKLVMVGNRAFGSYWLEWVGVVGLGWVKCDKKKGIILRILLFSQ